MIGVSITVAVESIRLACNSSVSSTISRKGGTPDHQHPGTTLSLDSDYQGAGKSLEKYMVLE